MDSRLKGRAVVVGHLAITIPVLVAILLITSLGLRTLGPSLIIYYVVAGMALGWQWHTVALSAWKRWISKEGLPEDEAVQLARNAALIWPGAGTLGPLSVHTAAAAICSIHLGPWLLSRWYAWILPLTGMSSHVPSGNDLLQNFELVSTVPALIAGYLLSKYVPKMGAFAWIVPTVILAYRLATFTEPYSSVFGPHPSIRFSYFFVIDRTMPTFTTTTGLIGDPVRVYLQTTVVASFYAGVAYSVGAFATKYKLLERVFERTRRLPSERV
jgi:hypothetical protein